MINPNDIILQLKTRKKIENKTADHLKLFIFLLNF